MELVLKKHITDCFERVLSERVVVEEAAEVVVPDTLPDIERILGADATVLIRSKQAAAGELTVTAQAEATVVWLPEGGGAPHSLSATVPFSFSAQAEALDTRCVPVARLTLMNVEARTLNPRKVVIRASVSAELSAWVVSEAAFTDAPEGETSVELLTQSVMLTPVVCVREKTFTVTDEYTLASPGELLLASPQVDTAEVRFVGGKAVAKGEARVRCVLADDAELFFEEFVSEFTQIIDTGLEPACPECAVYMMPTGFYIEPAQLSGGASGLKAELHMVAQVICSDAVEARYITDCCCNLYELQTQTQRLCPGGPHRRECVSVTLSGTAETELAPAAVLSACARIVQVGASAGGVSITALAEVAYTTASGDVYTLSRRVNGDAAADDFCEVLSVHCGTVGVSIRNGALELRVPVELELLCGEDAVIDQISAISVGERLSDHSGVPSLTVVRASEGDSLWSLAKRCHSTRTLITELNSLESGCEIAGRVLLIPSEK